MSDLAIRCRHWPWKPYNAATLQGLKLRRISVLWLLPRGDLSATLPLTSLPRKAVHVSLPISYRCGLTTTPFVTCGATPICALWLRPALLWPSKLWTDVLPLYPP